MSDRKVNDGTAATDELRLEWPVFVGVVTAHLEEQRRFYRDVLGLTELRAEDTWVWFDMGNGRLLELLALEPDVEQYRRPGVHVGFKVDDIHAAAEQLVARGVERMTEVLGGPESLQYWCYFRDRDGNQFELVQQI